MNRTFRNSLFVTLMTLLVASSAAASEPAPAPKTGCAVAKRTVVDADGTIHIVSRTVCKK